MRGYKIIDDNTHSDSDINIEPNSDSSVYNGQAQEQHHVQPKLMSMKLLPIAILLIVVGVGLGIEAGFVFFRGQGDKGDDVDTISTEFVCSNKSENDHEWIDLGLSVKWATCNIGASSPEEYGDYFVWGETKAKSTYKWTTYKWCKGSAETLTKYCTDSSYGGTVDDKTLLDLEDDAAHVNWGGGWRMPSKKELNQLRSECTWTCTTMNGVKGCKVVGPNGSSIFLPAAGYLADNGLEYDGTCGCYLSSSLDIGLQRAHFLDVDSNYSKRMYKLEFVGDDAEMYLSCRYVGQSVRPVCQ